MAVFKCKMCGGTLEINEGMSVCECEYCGTKQTLPKTDNEQNLNMINRANHFRQQCEFDKAMEIYERMLNTEDGDSEIYWSLVLCRYGIEYVDDPLTKKKIPTCHRTQFKSILDDADYLAALSHADTVQKELYQKEAEYIDGVQKGILEISNKEEPFDVFICYKESDNGKRTHDSVLAQELYYQLTQEGFKVFFSRITLEGKLGTAYEPYIFAALNSSKVMVVVGTKPEYFSAVWVKNEWSRYLMLMQNDKSKTLIPAYKDMDPYDLPDALSMFQAQDMSKLGFMQDLIRGISKIVRTSGKEPVKESVKETVITRQSSGNIENLIKRGNLCLEDENWSEADGFFEQVLNEDVEEARAYLGKLLAELKVHKEDELPSLKHGFSSSNNYKKALRFGYKKIEELNSHAIYNGCTEQMDKAVTNEDFLKVKKLFDGISGFKDARQKADECQEKAYEYLYSQALKNMTSADSEKAFLSAAEQFKKISGYKDSADKEKKCLDEAKNSKKYVTYNEACKYKKLDNVNDLLYAAQLYEDIPGFKDADELLAECKKRIDELRALEEAEKKERERLEIIRQQEAKRRAKRNKIIAAVSCAAAAVAIAFVIILDTVILPYKRLEKVRTGDFETGETITFGKYDWIVLDKNDKGALIITKDSIAKKQYNKESTAITWEDCSLRKYLNEEFYNEFSAAEKDLISETKVVNTDNEEYGISGGNDTKDNVFLLSVNEANEFFGEHNNYSNDTFWLRSPGTRQSSAVVAMLEYGELHFYGYSAKNEYSVRPVMNIRFE